MFDIGWMELLVIGVVALIVVGPKDLPKMFRTLGQVTGKMRAMAREFQSSMNAAAGEAGFSDVAKDLRNIANPKAMGLDALKDAAKPFEKWSPDSGKPESETSKLAKKRAYEAKDRVDATRKLVSERAAMKKAASEPAAPPPAAPPPAEAAAEPAAAEAPAEAAPETTARTGTSET